jgi:hypothetical protein
MPLLGNVPQVLISRKVDDHQSCVGHFGDVKNLFPLLRIEHWIVLVTICCLGSS